MRSGNLLTSVTAAFGTGAVSAAVQQLLQARNTVREAKERTEKIQDRLVESTADPSVLARHLFEEISEVKLRAYASSPVVRQRVDEFLDRVKELPPQSPTRISGPHL